MNTTQEMRKISATTTMGGNTLDQIVLSSSRNEPLLRDGLAKAESKTTANQTRSREDLEPYEVFSYRRKVSIAQSPTDTRQREMGASVPERSAHQERFGSVGETNFYVRETGSPEEQDEKNSNIEQTVLSDEDQRLRSQTQLSTSAPCNKNYDNTMNFYRTVEVRSPQGNLFYYKHPSESTNSPLPDYVQSVDRNFRTPYTPTNGNQILNNCSLEDSSRAHSGSKLCVPRSEYSEQKLDPKHHSSNTQKSRTDSVADSGCSSPWTVKARSPAERKLSRAMNMTPAPSYPSVMSESNIGTDKTHVTSSQFTSIRTGPTPKWPPEALNRLDSPHRGPHVGLINHGNTCYMSVIFQCLRFTPSVYSLFTNPMYGEMGGKLFASMSELFRNMAKQASHRTLYQNVEIVRSSLGCNVPQYSGSDQQDATEFLTCLLDMLHSELKPKQGSVTNPNTMCNRTCASYPVSGLPSEANDDDILNRDVKELQKVNTMPAAIKSGKLKCFSERRTARKEKKKSNREQALDELPSTNGLNPTQQNRIHPAIRKWEEENKSESSFFRDAFMSQLQSYRKCCQCSEEKLSFSVVWNLGVPIPQNSSSTSSPTGSISSKSNLQATKRCGGSPALPGQTGTHPKPNILFDGSNIPLQAAPLNAPGGLQYNPTLHNQFNVEVSPNHSNFTNIESETSSSVVYPSTSSRLPSPPLANAPPSYSAATARSNVTAVPLKDCLDACMLTEILDGADCPMCGKCGKKTACEMQHRISRLPDILVIQLLRFHCGERREKNDVPVNFPNRLDMECYIKSDYEVQNKFPMPTPKENEYIYWLYAVVYHEGRMSSGHYTTACLTTTGSDSSQNQWYRFDDASVEEIKPEQIHKPSAYLLFYERDRLYQKRKQVTGSQTKFTSASSSTERLQRISRRWLIRAKKTPM